MIPQLQKRLNGYIKKSEKNDAEYSAGKKMFEQYFNIRFDLDKKIKAVFELDKKRIKEQEFTDSQLDIWFEDKPVRE